MSDSFKSILGYKSMVWNLIRREIRGRYKGSILGFLWNFITPLIQILVYIMVFSAIFRPSIENYALYLTAGMIVWIYFADSFSEGSWIMMINADMLKKIYFPRAILPIAQILSKFINYLIMIVIFFIIVAIVGHGVCWEALLLIPVFSIIFIMFLIGATLIVSALDVFFRDIQYIVSVLLMALIWVTPIMYTRNDIDNQLLNTILSINPLTYFVEYFQNILYWKTVPSLLDLLICLLIASATLLIGLVVFNHLEKDFAEVL